MRERERFPWIRSEKTTPTTDLGLVEEPELPGDLAASKFAAIVVDAPGTAK